jgi:hypothetical protein
MKKHLFKIFLILIFFPALTSAEIKYAKFRNNGNGTITDTKTGLMWQQDGNASGKLFWKAALEYCKNLRLAGFSDWRAPTIDELKVLLNISVGDGDTENEKSRDSYLNNNGFKNVQSYGYWSVTFNEGTNAGRIVYMSLGRISSYTKDDKSGIIAVRSGL